QGLRAGGWKREGRASHFGLDAERHRRGDLIAFIAELAVHPEDARRDRPPPSGYRTLDMTWMSEGNRVPSGWDERPFRVFHEVGLRRVLPRGQPMEIRPEQIAELLPAQLELGCGPSIEAGIPHLSTLHRIYGVSRADYGFVFRPEHDGLLSIFEDPEAK